MKQRIIFPILIVLSVFGSQQILAQQYLTANINWRCVIGKNFDNWHSTDQYLLGAFLYSGNDAVRTSSLFGSSFSQSVSVTMIPYIRSVEHGTEYLLWPLTDNPEDFYLGCSETPYPRDWVREKGKSPKWYPEIWVMAPQAQTDDMDKRAYWQKQMYEYLQTRVGQELIEPLNIGRSPFNSDGEKIRTISQVVQKIAGRMLENSPVLNDWPHGNVILEKFYGFVEIPEDATYIPHQVSTRGKQTVAFVLPTPLMDFVLPKDIDAGSLCTPLQPTTKYSYMFVCTDEPQTIRIRGFEGDIRVSRNEADGIVELFPIQREMTAHFQVQLIGGLAVAYAGKDGKENSILLQPGAAAEPFYIPFDKLVNTETFSFTPDHTNPASETSPVLTETFTIRKLFWDIPIVLGMAGRQPSQNECRTCVNNTIVWSEDIGMELIGNDCVKGKLLPTTVGKKRFQCVREHSKDIQLIFDGQDSQNLPILITAETLNAYLEPPDPYEISERRFSDAIRKQEVNAIASSTPATVPISPTPTPSPSPQKITARLILPEIFTQFGDISSQIDLSRCGPFTQKVEKQYIYTAGCSESPEAQSTLQIKHFIADDGERDIPITVTETGDSSYDVTVQDTDIFATVTVTLPEFVGTPYYIAGTDIELQLGKSKGLRLPLTFPYDLKIQVSREERKTGFLGKEKPEWICDFERSIAIPEIGTPITLDPPCRLNVITIASEIPIPETAEPCITENREGRTITCLRKRDDPLTLTWNPQDKLEPKTISPEQLEQNARFDVTLVSRTDAQMTLILPNVFQNAPNIADRLVLPAECRPIGYISATRYTATCPRTVLKTLNVLEIKDFATDIPLQSSDGVTFRASATTVTRSVEITLLAADIAYEVKMIDSQERILPIIPGEILTNAIRIDPLPTMTLQPQEVKFHTACSAPIDVSIAQLLNNEPFVLTSPCQKETFTWGNCPGAQQPVITGCAGTPDFSTPGSAECVRRSDASVQVGWGNEEAPITFSAVTLNQNQSHRVNCPLPAFPVLIDPENSNVPYNLNAKFLVFATQEACEQAALATDAPKSTLYTAATITELTARETDWALVVKGDKRISFCAQGKKVNEAVTFAMKANTFEGERLIVVIENSKYLSPDGRGKALQDALVAWLKTLKASAQNLPVTLFMVKGTGEVVEILRAEDLLTLTEESSSGPSIVSKVLTLSFEDEGFQPLKHIDNLGRRYLESNTKLKKVLYFTDSRGLPERLDYSHLGTLLGWNAEGVDVKVVTNDACEPWLSRNLVTCELFYPNPQVQDVVQFLNWITQ